ncbi:hypothetical protein CLOBOL_00244 [Enterocloster bolteae ATCC BAA-613]|uniref:Uncharacterized protein n=1 Tax=Enterocloster bolteae (strain ATCC BAA-613 / DSM 15670 / CCUG 46953 / JCM 12243 / WAL 16351) TaxID=411902 RepID=A8RGW3_ENTBW|nr:hypothetical protein CLOBOL_00244 [Enterocloster bolteae ATCC BAA-613]
MQSGSSRSRDGFYDRLRCCQFCESAACDIEGGLII